MKLMFRDNNQMWSPFADMDRMMESMFQPWGSLNRVAPAQNRTTKPMWRSEKTEDGWTVEVDLPGFTKDEVSVEIEDGKLFVSAKKVTSVEQTNEEGETTISTKTTRSSSLTLRLNDEMDEAAISGGLENGQLQLTIPAMQPEEPQRRQIALN